MKTLMRFCLSAILLVTTLSLHAARSDFFDVRVRGHLITATLNPSLAQKATYDDASLTFNGAFPRGALFILGQAGLAVIQLTPDDDEVDAAFDLDDLFITNPTAFKNNYANYHRVSFILCKLLPSAAACNLNKGSTYSSNYTPMAAKLNGPPQTLSMRICPSAGNASCETHTVKTAPQLIAAGPTDGIIWSATQRNDRGFSDVIGQPFERAFSLAFNPTQQRVFVSQARTNRVFACTADSNGLPGNCQEMDADFTRITNIAMSPLGNALMVIDDGIIKRCTLDDSGSFATSSCAPITNTGDRLVGVTFVTFNQNGQELWAVSRANSNIYRCPVSTLSNSVNCQLMQNTGRPLRNIGVLSLHPNGNRFFIATGSRIGTCRISSEIPTDYRCRNFGVNFEAPVTDITGFVSSGGHGEDASFLVSLRSLGNAYPSTLLTCTRTARDSEVDNYCEPALSTPMTAPISSLAYY